MAKLSKSEFVWLGYSLGLKSKGNLTHLVFTESRVKQKVEGARQMMLDVFQYTQSIFIRYKLYKVYIAPIIECYLPAYLSYKYERRHELAVFQHACLTMVLGIARMCKISRVEDALSEKCILEKTLSLCERLRRNLRNDFTLTVDGNLRGGRNRNVKISGQDIDPADFCHRIITIYHDLNKRKFPIKKKFSHEYAKKSASILKKWTKNKVTSLKNSDPTGIEAE